MKREINRKNMRAFAREIFHTRNGWDYYRILCTGDLCENVRVEDEKTASPLHCVLGEMYTYFTGERVWSTFTSKFLDGGQATYLTSDLDTDDVVDYFIGACPALEGIGRLASINDLEPDDYKRAKKCAEMINEFADRLP